jgi:hypothetical protein
MYVGETRSKNGNPQPDMLGWLRPDCAPVYRLQVAAWMTARRGRRSVAIACLAPLLGCTSIDPGPNFVVADETFDANYFYCHIEPQFIFFNKCGPGDPSKGDPPNGCHFNPSAVSGMALIDHPAVNCGGGDAPLDNSQTGSGSPAQGNLESVSIEMSLDYMTAPLYVRPSGHSHPRAVISESDPEVMLLLSTWASK